MARVDGEPVRDVEHRVGVRRELPALLEPERRAGEPSLAERGSRGAERTGDDEAVAGSGSRAARHAARAAERRHAEQYSVGAGRVSARDRHARLVQALVQGEDVVELGVRGDGERDDERLGLGSRRGEVAEVDGGRAVARVAPPEEVEAEVDALDERVLRDDELADLRRVVLDALGEPAALELGQQAYLTELREPH